MGKFLVGLGRRRGGREEGGGRKIRKIEEGIVGSVEKEEGG